MIVLQRLKSIKEIARAIREQRKLLNLTQVEVAGLCGVGNRFIVELEQGKPTIEMAKALHISNMLGIKLLLTCETH